MKFLIDVHSIPRPERSGFISMIVMYVLLTGAGDVINAPYMSAVEHWTDLLCYVLPCSLFSFPRKPDPPQELEAQKKYRVMPLLFGGGKPGKPICACHFDVRVGVMVSHVHFSGENTCDSAYPSSDDRIWKHPFGYRFGTNGELERVPLEAVTFVAPDRKITLKKEDEFRFHCTEEDDRN